MYTWQDLHYKDPCFYNADKIKHINSELRPDIKSINVIFNNNSGSNVGIALLIMRYNLGQNDMLYLIINSSNLNYKFQVYYLLTTRAIKLTDC